jgi:hypothetical protein
MADPVTLQDIYDLFKASQADLQASRREFDQRMAESKAETDRSMAELRQIAANASREVGRLGERWGTFVENMVEPAVLRLFQERGVGISHTSRRVKSLLPDASMEIDILAVNGDVVVAIEVKSRLTQPDVEQFCEKLQLFKRAFSEYIHHQIYGAVAAIEFVQDVDRYAYRQGLFVIRQCGESVEIANDSGFQPRAW